MKPPSVSVIVPVYNHWELVPVFMERLYEQTVEEEFFELLIVDNGSDNLPEKLALPPWARLLSCSTPGSYAARNVGVGAAQGELIVFMDADCRPSPHWLEAGWKCWSASDGRCLVAGGIRVEPVNWNRMTVSEMFDVALGLPQQRYVKNGYAVTANLMIPKAAFHEVGLFDATRLSGGDIDYCRQATAKGWALVYCPQAEVVHPARQDVNQLRTKTRRVVGGHIKFGPILRRIRCAFGLMFPPVSHWSMALRCNRLSIRQRVQVCGLAALLKFVGFIEMIRLLLGGMPERR